VFANLLYNFAERKPQKIKINLTKNYELP
jgi:hypothetical protein